MLFFPPDKMNLDLVGLKVLPTEIGFHMLYAGILHGMTVRNFSKFHWFYYGCGFLNFIFSL